jgi:hypothetical protein
MFYRPHFCCHCGEKIIRARWTPLTSRRFCEFCAVEQKQHDLLPRVLTVVAVLIGAAGVTAYLGSSGPTAAPKPADALTTQRGLKSDQVGKPKVAENTNLSEPSISQSPTNSSLQTSTAATANTKQRALQGNSSTEAVYYCGAMTKKGTPCTRRVKTPGRCWQHGRQATQGSVRN